MAAPHERNKELAYEYYREITAPSVTSLQEGNPELLNELSDEVRSDLEMKASYFAIVSCLS